MRWRRRPVATGHWRHLDLSPGGSSTVLRRLEGCWRSQRGRATDLLPLPFPPPRCPFVPLPPNRPAVPSRLPSNGWAAAYMRRTPLGSIHLHLNPSDAKSKEGLGEEGSAFTSDAAHSPAYFTVSRPKCHVLTGPIWFLGTRAHKWLRRCEGWTVFNVFRSNRAAGTNYSLACHSPSFTHFSVMPHSPFNPAGSWYKRLLVSLQKHSFFLKKLHHKIDKNFNSPLLNSAK